MSDTSDVPVPPAVPDEPTPTTVTTSATPTVAPETVSTPVSGASADESTTPTETTSEDSSESTDAVPPTVVNDDSGQHVVMPDGSTVYTRSHNYPVSNSEWAEYEKTHAGDQARYPYVPGDKEYDAYSDPHVPNSHMANLITQEIASFAERVLSDPNAEVSKIWNTVKGVYEGLVNELIATGGSSGKVVE